MKKQAGLASIVGMLFATALVASLSAVAIDYQKERELKGNATEAGRDLSQISAALRSWVSLEAQAGVEGVRVHEGLSFLRSATCGGDGSVPEPGLLPCHVARYGDKDTPWGGAFVTEVTVAPSLPGSTSKFVSSRSYYVVGIDDKKIRAKMASVIADAARQDILGPADPANGRPTIGSFVSFFANADHASNTGEITLPIQEADFGKVVVAITNAPSNDVWLRTDGTNMMLAALNMGGNDLVNARNIQASGNARILGSVEVGNDLRVLDSASIVNDASIGRSLTVGQDAAVARDIVAGSDLFTGRDVVAGRDVVVGRDVRVIQGNILSSNGVNGDGSGIVVADDVVAMDVTLSNGASPRLSQGIYEARVVSGNLSNINKPTCPANGSTSQIFASFQSVVSPDGFPIHSSFIRVINNGNSWSVEPMVQTGNSVTLIHAPQSLVVVSTKCT